MQILLKTIRRNSYLDCYANNTMFSFKIHIIKENMSVKKHREHILEIISDRGYISVIRSRNYNIAMSLKCCVIIMVALQLSVHHGLQLWGLQSSISDFPFVKLCHASVSTAHYWSVARSHGCQHLFSQLQPWKTALSGALTLFNYYSLS